MSSDSQPEVPDTDEIQFDRADFAQTSSPTPDCDGCGEPLRGHYFEVNQKMACERCRYEAEAAYNRRGGVGAFFKAGVAGLGAAAAGSILYYAVREATGYEFGLISILVGFAVGYAVRWGSRAKGGWAYQSLAIFLTYMAIVSTYIPVIVGGLRDQAQKEQAAATAPATAGATVRPVAAHGAPPAKAEDEELTASDALLGIGALFLIAMVAPFLAGFENLIGLAIIAFGLYEAWKLNRRTALSISGPFTIGAAATNPTTTS